jgi:multiple sugar transport system permease protein
MLQQNPPVELRPTSVARAGIFSQQSAVGLLFIVPAVVFMAVFVAYPVFDAIRLSFYSLSMFDNKETFVGLANYVEILTSPKLPTIAWNTFVWTITSLAGQFALGLAAALCVNSDLPGMKIIRTVLLLPYVVPVIALALFWRWMLDGTFGIVSHVLQSMDLLAPNQSPLATPTGSMVSVVLANIWRGFPFVMISYWAALQSIPQDQYEAAAVDGASNWQQFLYVTLPHLADVTKVLFLLRLIWTVTFFDIIWLISRGGPAGTTEHWPIWIYQESMGFFRFGYGSALAVMLGIILLIVISAYLLILKLTSRR